jgi:hypothetical protein
MKTPPQQLYAFWKYDHYPYYLGGEILQVLDSGRVRVRGYDGMTFAPIKIIPAETGRKIKVELGELARAYTAASKMLEDEWRDRVNKALMIGDPKRQIMRRLCPLHEVCIPGEPEAPRDALRLDTEQIQGEERW